MSVRSQLTVFHDAPPSSERQSDPWFAVWTSANIRFEFDGAMATSILPTGDFGNPFSSRAHVVPPSRDMYTPLPGPPLNMAHVCMTTSHAPAISTLGSLASIASPEHPVRSSTNSTRCHVLPPSV